jgi:hypothetical protein
MSDLTADTNWNYIAENAVAGVLGLVPEVGSLLGALTYILWPVDDATPESVWDQIKQDVVQLMNQEIDTSTYDQVQSDLAGLNTDVTSYLTAIKNDDGVADISSKWYLAMGAFETSIPHFQVQNSDNVEVILLPLFAQCINLYLALLRDGVLYGASWGWTADTVSTTETTLQTNITTYFNYAIDTYNTGLSISMDSALPQQLAYITEMNLYALDFAYMWGYYDPNAYPPPVNATVNLSREIYSTIALGTATPASTKYPNLYVHSPQPLSECDIFSGLDDNSLGVCGVFLNYPPLPHPDTYTIPIPFYQGSQFGTRTNCSTQSQPIVSVEVCLGEAPSVLGNVRRYISGVQLTLEDGTNVTAGYVSSPADFQFQFQNEIVSSIYFWGDSISYEPAYEVDVYFGNLFLGFQYQANQAVNPSDSNLLRALYISNPKSISVDDILTKFTKGKYTGAEPTENWQQQKANYWNALASKKSTKQA